METLVLDVGYQPVQQVSWEHAIVWVLEKVVEVVEEHPDRYINTVNWRVNMPSVVRFLKPIPRKKAVKFSRQGVYLRDNGKCQYCGIRVARDRFTYDHVTPRANGGKTTWENIVVSCVPCNQRKGHRSLAAAGMYLKNTPVKPKKLPDTRILQLTYREWMPQSWQNWLRTAVYWTGELEEQSLRVLYPNKVGTDVKPFQAPGGEETGVTWKIKQPRATAALKADGTKVWGA